MSVTITEAAAKHIRNTLAERGHGMGFRVGAKKSGCSGYMYALDFVDELEPADAVFEQHGVKLVVDRDSLALIDGLRLDFVSEGLNQVFRFENPNVKATCGCGESFAV
ncbi:MAG: iron-sulfur cluster assembly accessory protein [Chromatiales bacterium]|nr:iron-sulfur cluster assembly accessory protein [Chromatiales bacterium]